MTVIITAALCWDVLTTPFNVQRAREVWCRSFARARGSHAVADAIAASQHLNVPALVTARTNAEVKHGGLLSLGAQLIPGPL